MNLRFPFPVPNSGILNSNGQAFQDIFVLSLLNGKKNGTYLEIGGHEPQFLNNSYLLSTDYDWKGVSIEYDIQYKPRWEQTRPNDKYIEHDALTLNYGQILKETFGDLKIIDYLQCDIEPSTHTFETLQRIPHDEYRFGVITFETDYYTGGDSVFIREESREFLSNLGYTLVIPDVIVELGTERHPFEDWYVDMNLVNTKVANTIKYLSEFTQNPTNLLFV